MSDRYEALGMPYPDHATVCRGQCEGTGFYPMYAPAATQYVPREGHCVPTLRTYSPAEDAAWCALHGERCLSWCGRAMRLAWAIRTGLEYAFAPRNHVIRENRGGRWRAFVRGWNNEIRCDGWHFITCPTCGGTGKR